MKHPVNILAIFDPTSIAQPAVEKAAVLATKFKARLEIFSCDVEPAAPTNVRLQEFASHRRAQLQSERKSQLELLAKEFRCRGLEVETDWATANVLHQGIIKKIAACSPDLVVKETHHHSLIKRTLITNTDWHLLRDCAAPVLLVKANHWSNRIRVLACVDPGHHADVAATFDHAILAWAAGLRTTLEGDLHVLHSYLPVVLGVGAVAGGMPVVDGGVIQEIIDTERTVQAAAVLSLVQTYDVPLANIHVPLGSPADTIQQDAESLNIDIVVMGAISRTALKRILIGSTAERTLDRLPCDVLVVKPLDFAADLPF